MKKKVFSKKLFMKLSVEEMAHILKKEDYELLEPFMILTGGMLREISEKYEGKTPEECGLGTDTHRYDGYLIEVEEDEI